MDHSSRLNRFNTTWGILITTLHSYHQYYNSITPSRVVKGEVTILYKVMRQLSIHKNTEQYIINVYQISIINPEKIQKNTFRNIMWVWIVVTWPNKCPQEFITGISYSMCVIYPSLCTKDKKDYLPQSKVGVKQYTIAN